MALFAAAVAFCPAVVALPDAAVADEDAAVAFVVAVLAEVDADVSLFFALVAAVVASVTFVLITPSRISNCVSTLVIRVSVAFLSGTGVVTEVRILIVLSTWLYMQQFVGLLHYHPLHLPPLHRYLEPPRT